MKKSELSKILTLLMGAYPNANVTQETIVVYEAMLGDFKSEDLYEVVLRHIATNKWFPSIAELREALTDRYLQFPSAQEAISILLHGSVNDLPQVAREALKSCGGQWEMKHTTMPGKWREEFRKRYDELVAQEREKFVEQQIKILRGRNPMARLNG
jgi:hypothetical protein